MLYSPMNSTYHEMAICTISDHTFLLFADICGKYNGQIVEEEERFELSRPFGLLVFKTSSIDHSDILP